MNNFRLLPVSALVFALALSGCKQQPAQSAPIIDNNPQSAGALPPDGSDPAAANFAPVGSGGGQPTRVLSSSAQYSPQQSSADYPQQQSPAPVEQNYNQNSGTDPNAAYDQGYSDAEANQAPPPLPEYSQPPAPEPDYQWTPGYWDYADTGYYWVPGTWVQPPYAGGLWTPGYWGYYGGRYRYHRGFWGLHIGYYGGINYGYGYPGSGYYGGYWNHDHFYYNRAVTNVNVSNVHNVYERRVVVNTYTNNTRVSYNGPGGSQYRPQPYELAAARERHAPPVQAQIAVRQQAVSNRDNFYAQNHGRPQVAAYERPPVAQPQPTQRNGFGPQQNQPQQRQQLEQQRQIADQQRQQQVQQQQNQRVQEQNQRQQQVQQRQLQNTQQQQVRQQQDTQRQQEQVQRQQLDQQRQQQVQQRQLQNTQQQQVRQQQDAQRQQEQAQRQRAPQQIARPVPAPQQHVEAPRAAPQPHVEAPRPAPQPHPAAPRPAPAAQPHAEAPHGEAPHAEGGHGGEHPH
jgi:chemotaxis protein histidine kinase CheA